MEPLFKTTSKFTLEEYKKFNTVVMKKKSTLIIIAIFEIIFVVLAFLEQNIFYLLFAIVYPIALFILQYSNIERVYNSNKLIKDTQVEYEFYENYFVEKHVNGESKIEYSMLYKVFETKTNFYLMVSKNQGYLLIKENFPEGLSEFLRKFNIK